VEGGGCDALGVGGGGTWHCRMVQRARMNDIKRWEFSAEVGLGWVVQQNCCCWDIFGGLSWSLD
jgi:hypothetical protein